MLTTRREFLNSGLAGLSFLSLGGSGSGLFAQAAREAERTGKNDHALIVVELAGGNDGLNTLIPFEDDLYYKNRRTLGIPKTDVVKISDALSVGLHPAMKPLGDLFKQGRLAIVQGVGYPEPDRSHFRSMEIWHTASTDKRPPTSGWLGKFLDTVPQEKEGVRLSGLALTNSLPQACQSQRSVVPVVGELDALLEGDQAEQPESKLRRKLSTSGTSSADPVNFIRRNAAAVYRTADRLKEVSTKYKSTVGYPESLLGQQLRRAAQILNGDVGARVLFVSQDGYDTHSAQADAHSNLLSDLATSLAALDEDLRGLKLADKVVVLVFSEFGRRVDENASGGTDHGAASCLFLQGAPVKGGLFGKYPSLEKLGDGDLIFNTDFRDVYATLLERWLGCPSRTILGHDFSGIDVLSRPT